MASYQPRIDDDLLYLLWLKARVECRPLTKVLNRILREKLDKEDVEKLEAQVKEACRYCGRIHGRKISARKPRVLKAEIQHDHLLGIVQDLRNDGGER